MELLRVAESRQLQPVEVCEERLVEPRGTRRAEEHVSMRREPRDAPLDLCAQCARFVKPVDEQECALLAERRYREAPRRHREFFPRLCVWSFAIARCRECLAGRYPGRRHYSD